MDATRWAEIELHFHRLADRPFAEQTIELTTLSATDAELAAAVRAMLEADASGRTILDRSPGSLAQELLDDGAQLPTMAFGPYRLTSLLGEGGMGVVYLGTRADLQAQAAIKVLRDAWLSPSRRERFLAEQRTLVSLEHPGIARLLDADRLPDGTPWFAMEYVEGVPITEYAAARQMPLDQRLILFKHACEAVRFAHERGVLHRDIKPSNVLVGRNGEVKLLDFGIAKTLHGAERTIDPNVSNTSERTRTQHRLLTPAYASPEQLRGETLGVQADVFALGVLLYELLTTVRPYETDGLSTSEAAKHIETQGAPRLTIALRVPRGGAVSLTRLGASARDDLDALVSCALHPDRARRYRSVDTMLADVARFERQEPLSAQPDSVSYRFRKFMARRWRETSVAALLAISATTAATVYTQQIRAARDLAVNEAARVSRQQQFLLGLFQGGASAGGDPAALPVRTLVSNGQRELQSLASDPQMQAEMYATIATLSRAINDTVGADSLLREAIRRKTALLGPNDPDVLRSRIEYAVLLEQRAKAKDAIKELKVVREIARSYAPPAHPVRAEVNEVLGRIQSELGETREGLSLLNEAAQFRAIHDTTSREYAAVLRGLGESYFRTQQYDSAQLYLARSVLATRRIYGDAHPELAYSLMSLATVERFSGQFAEAAPRELEGTRILSNWFGARHWYVAGARMNYGGTLVQLKKYRAAIDQIEPAIADMARQAGPTYLSIGHASTTLARAYEGVGALDSAQMIRDRAIRIYEGALGADHLITLREREAKAQLAASRAQVDAAVEMQRQLLAVAEKRYGANDMNVAAFRVQLGRFEWKRGRADEAIAALESGLSKLTPTTMQLQLRQRRVAGAEDLVAAYRTAGNAGAASRWQTVADSARVPAAGSAPTATSAPR